MALPRKLYSLVIDYFRNGVVLRRELCNWGNSWDLEWRVSSFDINIRCAVYESAMNSPKLCHELERLKNYIPKIFLLDDEEEDVLSPSLKKGLEAGSHTLLSV